MEDIKTQIRRFIIGFFLFGQEEGLADDGSLLEQGIIDSTGILELIDHLEKAYGIKVEPAEVVPENLDSINAIANFLKSKKQIHYSVPKF